MRLPLIKLFFMSKYLKTVKINKKLPTREVKIAIFEENIDDSNDAGTGTQAVRILISKSHQFCNFFISIILLQYLAVLSYPIIFLYYLVLSSDDPCENQDLAVFILGAVT